MPFFLKAQNSCGNLEKVVHHGVFQSPKCDALLSKCTSDPNPTGGDGTTTTSVHNEKMVFMVHGVGGTNTSWSNSYQYLVGNYKLETIPIPGYTGKLQINDAATQLQGQIISNYSTLSLLEIGGVPTQANENFIIAHSMGGIVSKNVYKNYYTTNTPVAERLVGGIATFATPHLGAEIADNTDEIKSLAANAIPALLKGPILDLVETSNDGDPILSSILTEFDNTFNNVTQMTIGVNEDNESTFLTQIDALETDFESSFLIDLIVSPDRVTDILNFVSGGSMLVLDFLGSGFAANATKELSPSHATLTDLNNTTYFNEISNNAIQFYGIEDPGNQNQDAALRLLHSLKNDPNLIDNSMSENFTDPTADDEFIDLLANLESIYVSKMTEYDELIDAGVNCWFDDWWEILTGILGTVVWSIENAVDCAIENAQINEIQEIYASLGLGVSYIDNLNDMFLMTMGGIELEETLTGLTCMYGNQSGDLFYKDIQSDDAVDCLNQSVPSGFGYITALPLYTYTLEHYDSDGVVLTTSAKGWPTANNNSSPNVQLLNTTHFEMKYCATTKNALDGLMTDPDYGDVFNVSTR